VDDIKDSTPCTLIYVKGRTSRTIKVIECTVMPSYILHGWSVLAECVVVKVTTIREDHEFEDLDYPNEEEGIENWLMLKRLSFSGPAKILLSKCIRHHLFHHGAQRQGALLLQTCCCLLKALIHQRLLPLKTLKTQSSRLAWGKGCLLLLLKTQSSRTTRSLGQLLLLLET
jgi:hypothetical protein